MLQVYGCFTTIHLAHNLDLECDENCTHVYNSYEQYVIAIKYFAPNILEEQLKQGIYQIKKDKIFILVNKTYVIEKLTKFILILLNNKM